MPNAPKPASFVKRTTVPPKKKKKKLKKSGNGSGLGTVAIPV